MAWETALDRLLLQEVHKAESGELRKADVTRTLNDFWALTSPRAESAFHLGYARVLLGVELVPETKGLKNDEIDSLHRWYDFGRLRGHDRLGERTWVADLVHDPARLMDLLNDPRIAAQCLPVAMRTLFYSGDFELGVNAIAFLDSVVAGRESRENRLIVDAALTDLATRLERAVDSGDETSPIVPILHKCFDMPAFADLPPDVQARYHRVHGQELLRISEFESAGEAFAIGYELADDRLRMRSSLALCCALACLRVHGVDEVHPSSARVERDEAGCWLEKALERPEDSIPEAFYVQGILRYEIGDYQGTTEHLGLALKGLRRGDRDLAVIHHASYYLGAALLILDRTEETSRALRLVEESLDTVQPDLETCYGIYEALKTRDRKLALRFLDSVDVGRGTSAEQILLVALEYLGLGEAEPAATAANRVLDVALDLDQRIEAMNVLLTAGNMQGDRDRARRVFDDMRDLLMQRGAFEELEKILKNEDVVGQALDHLEVKLELVALYEEMDDRDAERATLKTQIARSLRARKDTESLMQALGLLREVEVRYPELAQEDVKSIEKLLALEGAEVPAAEGMAATVQELGKGLGRKPRILVVGGNERQRRHHTRLDELGSSWGFDGEWMMANYTSPQRTVSAITEQVEQGLDLLILLHWNRHETTEPALELARKNELPARTVHYAGFTSLEVALGDMFGKLAQQQVERQEPVAAGAGSGKGSKRKKK